VFSLHIEFEDGSNPWYRLNMTPEEFGEELIKWSKKFRLDFDMANGNYGSCFVFMKARQKEV